MGRPALHPPVLHAGRRQDDQLPLADLVAPARRQPAELAGGPRPPGRRVHRGTSPPAVLAPVWHAPRSRTADAAGTRDLPATGEPQPGEVVELAQAVADRRGQLLAAAREAFAERGYHGTTVRDVCERGGVSVGTFYLYFANKEACFLGLIDDLYAGVLLAAAGARAGCPDPLDKLAASVGAVLRTFRAQAELARIVLVHAPGTHPSFDARLRELHVEFAQLVRRDLDEAVDAGTIPPQDTETAALAVIGAVYEVTVAHIDGRTGRSLDESLAALTAVVRRAVGAR